MVGCYCSRSFAFTFLSSSIFTYYIHTSYLVLYLEVSVSYYLSLAIFFCDLHTLSHVPFSLSHYLSLWLAYTLSCCFIFFLSLSLTIFLSDLITLSQASSLFLSLLISVFYYLSLTIFLSDLHTLSRGASSSFSLSLSYYLSHASSSFFLSLLLTAHFIKVPLLFSFHSDYSDSRNPSSPYLISLNYNNVKCNVWRPKNGGLLTTNDPF